MRRQPLHAFGRRDHTGRESRTQKSVIKQAETLHETAFSVSTISATYPEEEDLSETVVIITKTIGYLGILDDLESS